MSKQAASSVASSSRRTLDEPCTDAHQELLTEHFGFNPRVFIDALVYAANEHLYSIGSQFEDFAKGQLEKSKAKGKGGGVHERDVERGVHSILTLLENALDHTFDLLELYCLKAVFGIRPSQASFMTLAHHRGLDLRTSAERVENGGVDALSAKEEGRHLQEQEGQLRKQIAKAKGLRHALRLANISASRSLLRAEQLAGTFSALLVREDGSAQLPSILPQSARKLSADASSLLKALDDLIGTDSLGSSLLASKRAAAATSRDRKRVMEESGASEEDRKAWERGREGYINWEIDRIVKSVHDRRRSDFANQSILSTPARKRRKTEDVAQHDQEPVGDAAELESLAKRMQDN